MRDKFRSVVAANVVRFSVLPNDFFHKANQTGCWNGMGDLLCHGDTVAVIDDFLMVPRVAILADQTKNLPEAFVGNFKNIHQFARPSNADVVFI